MMKQRHFYDEDNLQQFKQQYQELPIYKRLFENKALAYSLIILTVILLAQPQLLLG